MTKYCITAANHDNFQNHCASKFKMWEYVYNEDDGRVWIPLGEKSLFFIADLLNSGHEVITARENSRSITRGAPVEIELRIARNETHFKISEMPEF